MKTLLKSILIISVFISVAFSQNWNNPIQTIGSTLNTKLSSSVDARGIHISYIQDGTLKYGLVRPNGDIVKSNRVIASENCQTSVILVKDNLIFVLFKQGNSIKLAKSTNEGDSWLIQTLVNNENYVIGERLDAVIINIYLFYVYYETTNNNSYLKCFNLTLNDEFFHSQINLQGEVGRYPSLARSNTKLHILYFTSTFSIGDIKVRDFNLQTMTFEEPQLIPRVGPYYLPVWANRHYITTNNSKVHVVYISYGSTYNNTYEYVGHFTRDIDGTNWTSQNFNAESNKDYTALLVSTVSNDIHLLYYDKNQGYLHKKFNGQSWTTTGSIWYGTYPSLKSNSNDLYLIYNSENTIGNPDPVSIKLRQYDAAPLAPTNLTVTAFNGRPKLVWTINSEPDVRINNYAYKIERRLDVQGSGQWSNWQQIGTSDGQTGEFVDNSIISAGSGPSYAQYRLRAQDIGGNYSDYSSSSTINYGNGMEKMVYKNYDFKLIGNYPNPFNPETKITFSIPQSGKVYLKVYNIIGEMIAELTMNELEAGEYHLLFNSEQYNLKSGIYFYELRFNENKSIGKMVLIK